MIQIEGLYKYYGTTRAVGPIDLQVSAGEVVGLLGENGAGKSTTLRVLACELLPSAGRVKVDGHDVVDDPDAVRASIGYLPDKPPLYPEMTVREYLGFAARLRGVARADTPARVAAAAEQAALTSELDAVIGALSHGFQQRVGIAQAIVHRPRFVVLDEPISGLDPRQIVEMRRLIRGLAGEHTVLISSHILSEISQTCDRLLVIRDGEIVADDTEEAIVQRTLGGARIRLLASGLTAERLATLTSAVPQATLLSSQEEAGCLRLELTSPEDVRARLARWVVESGAELLEIGRSEHELERVFMRLASPEQAS
ncbi:MAG: ABC transporter ATP-binding protein [Polyangiaceae bacterium]|nr:ABC transporter ATP-binding protein [Polyangiaceae bacterium]MCW5791462.1 ABC transporter ATP-binding protein [Polyangiaceae bacterium]